MEKRGGLINEESEDVLLGEEVEGVAYEDDFKRKAIALAATFGDSSVHRCEKKCLRIAALTSGSSNGGMPPAGKAKIPNSASGFYTVV